jgi:hypothetical protein
MGVLLRRVVGEAMWWGAERAARFTIEVQNGFRLARSEGDIRL